MKKRLHIKFLLFSLLSFLLVGFAQEGFSQNEVTSANQGLTINPGGSFTYCDTDPIDDLSGAIPNNKNFSGTGIVDAILGDGLATFDPGVAGVGTHTIKYNNKDYFFIVSNPGPATLAAFAPPDDEVCENEAAFALYGGLPVDATGTYWVNGVADPQFDPATANIGANSIQYSVGSGGCVAYSNTEIIDVFAVTVATLTLNPTDVCKNDAQYVLIGGSPVGGVYSGTGVVGGTDFDPATAGLGTETLTYTYTNAASCVSSVTDDILVHDQPVVKAVATTDYCFGTGGGTLTVSASDVGIDYELYRVSTGVLVETQAGTGGDLLYNTGLLADDYFIRAISQLATGCSIDYGNETIVENALPVVTFNLPVGDEEACIDKVSFALSVGLPGGGSYSGVGVAAGNFDPAVATAGVHVVTYSYTDVNLCTNTADENITVYDLPVVTLTVPVAYNDVCIDEASFALSGGLPVGGIYDIDGGVNANFDPAAETTVPAPHVITYTYTDANSCVSSATDVTGITVHALPVVGIVNLDPEQCDSDAPYQIEGNIFPIVAPAPANGVFTFTGAAAGVVDNNNGSAQFIPGSTGLGVHTVTYTYTDEYGCSDVVSEPARVGTLLNYIGLNDNFCSNDPNFTFQYTPGVPVLPGTYSLATNPVTVALTDNADGTADVDLTTTPSGTYDFIYTLNDDIGCVNVLTKSVTISSNPTASIAGLNASYCENDADVSIDGLPTPVGLATGVFTTLIAGLTDTQTGTETFSPSTAPIGNNHDITYTYTDAFGCSDAITEQVSILAAPSVTLSGDATICEGNPTDLTFTFASSSDYTVVFSDGTNNFSKSYVIADLDAVTFEVAYPVTPLTTTTYSMVSVTDDVTGCTGTTAGTATIVVNPEVAITVQPVDAIICETDNASFTLTATGQNLSYAWTNDAVPAGGNSNTLALNNVALVEDGSVIECVVTSTCGGPVTSSQVILTVQATTVITVQSVGDTKCTGDFIDFTVTATGSNLTYQWEKDGVPLANNLPKISGATTDNLAINSLVAGDAASYRCVVTGDCGVETSNSAALVVNDPIVITVQPVDISACETDNIVFDLTATGTALSYQWWFDDGVNPLAPLGNATSQPVNGVTVLEVGTYYCEVSTPCGEMVTSNLVTLSLNNPTVITLDPVDAIVCEGGLINFIVTATGSNLTYLWYKDGVAIAPAETNSVLSKAGLILADAGNYRCEVTGDCGVLVSNAASLIIEEAVTFNSQPVDATVCPLVDVIFTVDVNGSNLLYDWELNAVSIGGANNTNYTALGAAGPVAGNYRCKISNACGDTYSDEVQLIVNTSTSITSQPSDVTTCEGNNESFSITAAGTNLSYEWYKDAIAIAPAETNPILNLAALLNADGGNYTCVVTGTCGGITSAPGILEVDIAPTIGTHPQGATNCPLANTNLTVVAATGTNLNYQWNFDPGSLGVFGPVGVNSPIYNIPNFAAGDEGDYYCEISNGCGSITSNTVTRSLGVSTNITVQPVLASGCIGDNANFSITSLGSGLIYEWRLEGVALVDDARIVGSATNSLSITGLIAADDGNYTCQVSGDCGNELSNSVSLTVDEPVSITLHPVSDEICEGQNTSFSVNATGTGLSYLWYIDGAPIAPAETGTSYIIANAVIGTHNGAYYCEVSNGCTSENSNTVNLIVNETITILAIDQPTDVADCEGALVNFTVNPSTGTNLSYQWRKDGVDIFDVGTVSGTSTNTLTITGVVVGDQADYSCYVNNVCDASTSLSGTLTVSEAIAVTAHPQTQTGCSGDPLNLVTIATGTNLTYLWYIDGAPVPAETNSVFAIGSYTLGGDDGTYYCEIKNSCGITNTNDAIVTDGVSTLITTDPTNELRCVGGVVSFNVVSTGTNLTYQWQKDGANLVDDGRITSTNSNTLSIINIVTTDLGEYSCDVTGDCGTVTSLGATLTVSRPPVISTQPISDTVCDAGIATFNIVTTGDNLTYQWQLDAVVQVGETNTSITIDPATSADDGVYNCIVTNIACGSVTSTSADLVVYDNLVIVDPVPQTVCEGANIVFTAGITGPPDLSTQWFKDGVALVNGGQISGAQSNTLGVNSIVEANQGAYYIDITSRCGSFPSNIANLTVDENVTITIHPTSFSVLNGNDANFSVVATGDITGYQWRKDGGDLVDIGGQISGALTSTLTVEATDLADEGTYTCLVTGNCVDAVSDPADLTVTASSLISVHPATPVTKCEGETLNLSITSTGTTFEWRVDGVALIEGGDISGSATQSLILTNLLVANQGAYTCFVDGTESSLPSVVTVNPTTAISVQPNSATKCEGDNIIFAITADGAGIGYQWQKNNIDIAGETNSTYIIDPLVDAHDGSYHCNVTGTCGNLPSDPATLVVNINTVIGTQPSGATICEETSTTLSVVSTGDNLAYQWYKDGAIIGDGGTISGTNSKDLVISNALLPDAGIYNCEVQGDCGSVNSIDATVVVNPKTAITVHPISRTLCAADNVVFNVSADGDNLTYQWYKDAGIIVGETNSSYTINGLVKADEGSYTCIVTGTCSNATSNPAVLVVNDLTNIIAHPIGGTICENGSISLIFDVSGDGLSHQWYLDGGAIVDGGSFSGSTTSNLIISNAVLANDGIYTCNVIGACGNENSNTAQVVVDPATVINTHPQNETRCETDVVTFVVNATGTNLTYQWQKNGVNLGNVGNVTGAFSASLNITNLTSADADNYTCIVSGDCNNLTSSPAILTINDLTAINTHPLDATLCEGSSTTLLVDAVGTNLLYQWKLDGVDISDVGSFTGTNTNTLLISNCLTTDEGTYTCVVSGDCFSANSQPAYVTVQPTTSIVLNPQDKTRCTGDNVLFAVSALGDNLTYQWQLNNTDIVGEIANNITINPIAGADEGAYTCVISGTCGDITSNPGILTVQLEPVFNLQPVDVITCEDNVANFNIDVTGTNLIYQWQKDGVDLSDVGNISGTNTNTLNIDFSVNGDEGIYDCNIQGTCGNLSSDAVLLTVVDSTVITLHPVDLTIVENSDAFFNVAASGEILGYQWQKDGVNLNDVGNISGSTTALLSVTSVTTVDEASYTCIITGTCGTKTTNPGLLMVDIPVSITTDPVDATKCVGEAASFTVSATGTGLSYQWTFNGANISDGGTISGSTTSNLIISSVTVLDAGTYSCAVDGNYGNGNSLGALLSVNETVAITQQPLTQSKCEGDNLIIEVIADGDGILYQWSRDNVNLVNNADVNGSNSSLLIITNITNTDEGSYRCTLSNTCNTEVSNPAIVTINPSVAFSTQPVDEVKCEGQSVSFSVVATGVSVQYQWYKDGTALNNGADIIGVTTNNLIINNLALADAGNYSCYISDNCSTDNSSVAVLTINSVTQITLQPSSLVLCENEEAHFEVVANGYNIVYKWQKDGANLIDGPNIFGSNESVLIINSSSGADEGNYRCNITGGCTDELTSPASLTVDLLPSVAGVVTGTSIVCQGEQGVLYVVSTINNALSYVWDLPYGATIVSGDGTRSIIVDYANDAQSGTISVHGQNSCGDGGESAAVGITVNLLPTADASIDQIVCGESTAMDANAVAGTWSILSGDAVIANTTMFNTNIDFLKQGDNEFIWTVTQNSCVARDTVTISNTTISVNAGEDQVVCSKSTNLQAITPATGATWAVVSGSGFITNVGDPNSEITSLLQGENQFAWVVNNQGCISSDVVSITNDLPVTPYGGINQIVDFDQATMDANPTEVGTIGTWSILSGGGSFVDVNDPQTLVTTLSPGENVILWAVQRNNCILGDTILVENIMIEDPEAGPNQSICTNTTELDAISPDIGTGEWSVISGAAEITDILNNTSTVTNIGHGENWLRWTVRTSGNGVESDSILIINNEATVANAGSDVVICVDTFTLMGNTPIYGTGSWILNSGSGLVVNTTDPNTLINNLGQGGNELKWTITNENCITDASVTITNNTPTVASAGADQTVCYDSVLLLPNTPTIGIGSWNLISGSGSFSGNIVTQISPDLNIYRYTITEGNCTSSDDVSVTNNKPTTPDASYDQNICTSTVLLDANQALQGTGEWSIISGSGTFADINNNNPEVTDISNGINIYRWTITKNGCVEQDEVSVSNNFVLSSAGLDVDLCTNEYQLLASNPSPGVGIWSIEGTSGATFTNQNDPSTLVTNLSNGENLLRWTVTNNGCISTDDVIVANYLPSVAFAGENQAVCGNQASLNGSTPIYGTGLWTVMGGSGSLVDPSDPKTDVTNLNVGANILRWTISQNECVSYDDVTVISNMAIDVFAGNDQIACSDTAVLSANPVEYGVGQWSILSGAGTFDNPTNNETIVRNLGKGDNQFKWIVSNSDCHVVDTVVITSNIPTPSVAGADQILCSDNTLMAGNTPSVGLGQWILISGSAVIETPSDPNSVISSIQLGNTTLRWSISEAGCYSDSEVTLTNNQPSTPFAGYDTDICSDSVRLFAEPTVIGSGVWTLVSGDAVIITPDSNQTQVQNIKFNDNTFRWTVTNKNCVLYDDVVVTSNLEYVNAGDDRQVNTATIQLIANKPSQGVGLWKVSASPAFIETPDNFETMVSGLGSGANVFTWTITNNECTSTDDVIINYVVMPVADFDPSSVKGCPPMLVNFVNTSIGGTPYEWNFGDGETSTEHSVIHAYMEPGVYKAVLTATAPLGLTVTKDTFITVYENPIADFSIAPETIYVPGEHISCFNYSIRAETSQWFFGDGTYITEYAPTYSYTEEGIYDITLKAISKEGCVDSMTIYDAIEVLPRSDFFFPDAFTPNTSGGSGGAYNTEDRSNDVFYPIVVDGELADYEFVIYNRLGVMLFKTNDINVGWDGYYKNKMQPHDVYVFLITGKYNNGQPFKKTGNVLLIVKDN